MNIWWCEVVGQVVEGKPITRCRHFRDDGHQLCGYKRLVPADALVLVRDADGLWPQWAVNVFDSQVDGEYDPFAFFDALAEAAKDNPR